MSNMAEVNGTDHLVRHEKETRLNGYDNEGYHCQERSADEEDSANDDDRLRVVVTENGHRPEDDSHLSNGRVHEESNGHSTTVNGSAVIVLEESKADSNMNDNKDESSQKPLDTRLHHYVPVDDIDRKILNGSDGTHVTIPEDAIINFNTGRVKVRKGASNNPPVTNERESIPLETMLPSYEGEDKVGLGEKAELEAELANHKNGLWSEGHNAYSNPEGPFGNSEKLNGTSKSSDEVGLPVNNHRKCLRGEKLYFTDDNRKLCPGWRRVFVCGLILIILAVALLLGVLAATGILLAESESKNTRYESGHSLPSIDSISHAGHSFRPRPSSSKVPQKFLPPVTGDAPLPAPNSTVSGTGDTVSRPHPTVSSKVPVLNDSSHSQTIVPNALVGEFIIDENFTEDLKNSTSDGYQSLANYIERELRGIFKRNSGMFEELKILNFSPGSIKVKFVTIWASDRNVLLSQKAMEILKSYLRKNRNSLLAYPVDLKSIHFKDVFDECRVQKGGCSFNCIWDYNRLAKTCTCEENMMLLVDGKSCGPKPSTSYVVTTPKFIYRTPSTTSTFITETPLSTEESTGTTAVQPEKDFSFTTQIPTIITEAIATISELLNDLTTTETSTDINETTPNVQNFSIVNESSSSLETVTEQSITEKPTIILNEIFTTVNPELIHETITEMPSATNNSIIEDHVFEEFNTTENSVITSNTSLLNATTLNLEPETITQNSATSTSKQTEVYIVVPEYIENHNESTTEVLHITDLYTTPEEAVTTIGYRIENETTEIYTLKEGTDFDFEATHASTPESNNVTDELSITLTESSFQTTSNRTIPEKVKEFVLTTEIPDSNITAKVSRDSTTSVVISTTETPNHTTLTESPNFPITDTTINVDDIQYTTKKDTTEIKMTDINDLKEDTDYSTLDGEVFDINSTTSTLLDLLSNETKEFQKTTTASTPVTTIFSIPPVIPHSNKTPEVRSFDEDLENSTFAPTDYFNTEGPIPEASTEVNTFANNSSTTVSKADDTLLTSSPVTTPISTTDFVFNTTLPMNVSEESSNLETTINVMDDIMNVNKSISNTEKTINVDTNPTVPSSNVSLEDSETLVTTESFLDLSTENSHVVSHNTINETLDTTIQFNESDITTLRTTETESLNDTYELPEISEAMLNESFAIQNFTEMNVTVTPSDTFENESMNTPNGTHISEYLPDTTSFYNETGITESYDIFPDLEIVSSSISVNKNGSEFSNSSRELGVTENSHLLTPTFESENLTNDQTIFENTSFTTTISTILDLNETSTTTEKMIGIVAVTDSSNFTHSNESEETYTSTTVQDFTFPTPPYSNESEINTTQSVHDTEMFSTIDYNNVTFLPGELGNESFTHTVSMSNETFDGVDTTLVPGMNESLENSTLIEDLGNFTTGTYEDVTNEITTNASTGIECRDDQFLCEPLNKCINETFLCDGISDCPDSSDEFDCKDTCHSNFMCTNSSTCIMSDVRCDGIWDCENGTDEDNCTPTECAKHEVMCSDGSSCIKPGYICDWKYNCLDRSDEVGCVERTTCESLGRFFCNDGLCIPWSLKCDGEHDCKDGEDEGNCTCLNDEFQCNDGKCLKSSSRCDGRQDCHDADDEMGCVSVDSNHIVSTYEPYSGTWGLLCAEDWTLDDGQYLCEELGFGHALDIDRVHVSFNGTWMKMRRDNLTDTSLWTERVAFDESCTSSLAAVVECQKFQCGEYTGLLHRRKRDVISTSSSQWPFIGYTSTFHSNRGCLSEILTPVWLITSVECLLSISKEPFNGSDWYVRTNVGKHIEADLAQKHEVLRIINHPHSSKFRSLTVRDYDAALIRLKHALIFVSDKIGAICPPDEQVPPGITCFSSVLGTEKPRAPPPQSLTINFLALQIIDKENCNGVEHYNNAINQRMLCTQSSEGHTICDNDEGTPLMCLSGINKWFLAGMLTYQRFCDVYSKHPAVFSNLFSMRKFLDQVTGQKQYEIPYDSNVYIIIPPTTPSPTLPETTTLMTTITTTETTLFDTTYLTTIESENMTETMFENFEEMNSTTAFDEELARDENYTTVMPVEFNTDLINSTYHDLFENETVSVLYGMGIDVINTTSEEINDDLLVNRTHSYLISLLNDTYTDAIDDGINTTDISVIDNSTYFSNVTSSDVLIATTVSWDFTTMPTPVESNVTINELDGANLTTTTSSDLLNLFTNETKDPNIPVVPAMNETTDNLLSVSALNDTIDDGFNLTDSNLNETANTDLSLIAIFNETLEMFKPMMALTNESMVINQPFISITNKTAEMEIESPIALPTVVPYEIGNAENVSTEANVHEMDTRTSDQSTEGTTEIPTTKIITVEARTEFETTASPITNATESFTFEVEGEPDTDLSFYVFNISDGLKFEPYSLPENITTNNVSKGNISETGVPDTNLTTIFPSINETVNDALLLPSNVSFISSESVNITELFNFTFNNMTDDFSSESETAVMGNATSVSIEVDTKSETLLNTSILHTENYENVTVVPAIETGINETEDSVLKARLISEKLTILQDDTPLDNLTDCGIWGENAGALNYSDSENVLMQWPALGFLQMISEPKVCASAVVSPKFVITSLNCMSIRDNELDPDKWTYVGGLDHVNNSSNVTQNHLVSKIIPYPNQSIALLFDEHDVALVKIKDTIAIDEYSKYVCMAKDASIGRDCFTAGWNKKISDGDIQKQFYSIPLSIISTEECNNTMNYNGTLLDSLICGSNSNESLRLCQMDLGSPLFCLNEKKHWEIQGILNFPSPCDIAQPTVFNSIASVRRWIIDIITNDEKLLK